MHSVTEAAERFHQKVDLVEAVSPSAGRFQIEVVVHDPATVREHERDVDPRPAPVAILLVIARVLDLCQNVGTGVVPGAVEKLADTHSIGHWLSPSSESSLLELA